jgi:putative aldouronate transport system permease protein
MSVSSISYRKPLRKRPSMNLFDYANHLLMFLIILLMVFPLYYCFIVSISDGEAVMRGEVVFRPIGMDWTAYKAVLDNPQILRSYANTLKYTVLGTAINIFLTSLCAYPLCRPHLKGRRVLNALFVATMFVNGGMIPLYLQVKALELLDTIWAVVLPLGINTYNMIIMRTFFSSIPDELHEASEIDGASQFQTFFRVILPLSETILATMVLFYAVAHWNSYMPALLYLNSTDKMPLQMMIRKLVIDSDIASMTTSNSSVSSESLLTENKIKYAVVMISVLPMLVTYPFLQRYFVKGVMIGSVKG